MVPALLVKLIPSTDGESTRLVVLVKDLDRIFEVEVQRCTHPRDALLGEKMKIENVLPPRSDNELFYLDLSFYPPKELEPGEYTYRKRVSGHLATLFF